MHANVKIAVPLRRPVRVESKMATPPATFALTGTASPLLCP
jgi:hypothetical protein